MFQTLTQQFSRLLGALLLCSATLVSAALPAPLDKMAAQLATQQAIAPEAHKDLAAKLENALAAGVAEADLQAVMRLAATRQYTAAHVAALLQQLVAVHKDGLPPTLVRDKILEGMAKKVPVEAVLKVAAQWHGALKSADKNLKAIEARGLKLDTAQERAALVNLGASLLQRHGVADAIAKLVPGLMMNAPVKVDTQSLIAAAQLAEFLLHYTPAAQAIKLSAESLHAGYSAAQIAALQRGALDQLRQGIATADLIQHLHQQLERGLAATPPASPGMAQPHESWSFPGGRMQGELRAPGADMPNGPSTLSNSYPPMPVLPGAAGSIAPSNAATKPGSLPGSPTGPIPSSVNGKTAVTPATPPAGKASAPGDAK